MFGIKFCVGIITLYSCCQLVSCITSSQIVNEAIKHIGSTKWSYASSYSGRPNWDKYSLFIYDVLKSVNAKQPEWEWWIYTPYGPAEWGNPNSAELKKKTGCWKYCGRNLRAGDVISNGIQVGFVRGFLKSIRATKTRIEESSWGFGASDSITGCWRYSYTSSKC